MIFMLSDKTNCDIEFTCLATLSSELSQRVPPTRKLYERRSFRQNKLSLKFVAPDIPLYNTVETLLLEKLCFATNGNRNREKFTLCGYFGFWVSEIRQSCGINNSFNWFKTNKTVCGVSFEMMIVSICKYLISLFISKFYFLCGWMGGNNIL